jgi:hypothetical protein
MHRTKLVAPLALAALLAGCTDTAKLPAEQAIKAAEATLAGVKADAAKYAADQLKAVEGGLAKAKEAAAKGDFKAALDSAKELPAKATALVATVKDRKDEESRAFAMATAQLPQLLEGLKGQLEGLSAAKKLPAGTTAAAVASAKEELAALVKSMEEATAKATAGSMAEATKLAQPLKDRALALAKRVAALAGKPAK